ncbi:putative inactive purple acid phosphatase 1 [Senna tora]|uniref:Putative inactive purple acid phosphatase 1 n=1 Tax=Senna tora TaxID=362788 RepID=A0A834WLR0_9FABA|nr:putative inactive purple acid phosphatase 1 [Senna tora]
MGEMGESKCIFLAFLLVCSMLQIVCNSHGVQPLSKIAVHKATFSLLDLAYIKASPQGQNTEWVSVEYSSPMPSNDDWIGIFSPANFSASTCPEENRRVYPPLLCSAPIKYQFANYTNHQYKVNGKGFLRLQLINQRSDFSFALFSGGLSNVSSSSV